MVVAASHRERSIFVRPVRRAFRCTRRGFRHLCCPLVRATRCEKHLTNRWSQPLAGVMSRFDFMKQFPMFATLVLASGG